MAVGDNGLRGRVGNLLTVVFIVCLAVLPPGLAFEHPHIRRMLRTARIELEQATEGLARGLQTRHARSTAALAAAGGSLVGV